MLRFYGRPVTNFLNFGIFFFGNHLNKKDANQRDNVLFINADREYKEASGTN